MPELDPAPIATGIDLARRRVDHGFVGLDPPWARRRRGAKAQERSRLLLAAALTLDARAGGEGIDVTLSTGLAGHAIPTGASFLRRIWVDVDFAVNAGSSRAVESSSSARVRRAGVLRSRSSPTPTPWSGARSTPVTRVRRTSRVPPASAAPRSTFARAP